ncbi:MAG: 50S ribosomal protein L13 [Candidatus Blackburnbacteria bacterium RIFCSPHIGHO2_01_FULL_44_64]|uniref:Large ribosomal subunit protein uL13 n=1 Tax=Candidatus Blackburnbacteria bacterium RIFCSPHIGHO2_02_FULL_44_20 TaxID=1797516 RepID=A0A1G1VAX4_9BACT|nr:MAG: 50S ribosomal protein L13 [Candidatus Blackburnbacteria bacterium RIFCSPHIGHO2_01_FULL_44_64]OGY11833.1 MAG: 50S ribosomal protein L13 [Candidatus Blackburnbacteria bacterium RIFCSPHIGHO2_12_FULL_44_25]OGY12362.1 MAG: 50S ribosomal protein L13 [Candidatus Blackburnbacteria bacterium RIFCSPHIGHO2_02_FULL_44_20]OGY15067.1 MAG: 50S ribosomal protein L13 [Candidatus Blackburnbacteria bacterium RIFCSPLOWO2_01_FULL_44_43]OGY16005.1 MAG: 50S ribosomal protein L13 [Candidatus Blackburnbacteria 
MYKSYQTKGSEIKRSWRLFDAQNKILGRLATEMAIVLMGKDKKTYSPHMDQGDYVVVVNAKSVKVTGNKEKNKIYWSHSGYPGGLKSRTVAEMREKNPTKIIELAVRRMLPKNRLQDVRMARLKVFSGSEHLYSDKLKGEKATTASAQ